MSKAQTIVDNSLCAWAKPEALGSDLLPVPQFDLAMLPVAFRAHVSDVAELMQVPIDLPAVGAVAALAGAVNRRAMIQPKRVDTTWIVVPNLWGGAVAQPGFMKSPVLSAFTGHLERIEHRWYMEHESEVEDYEQWKQDHALRERAYDQQFVAAIKAGKSPPIRPDETRAKPVLRRLTTNDPTVEALQNIMAANPAGLLLVRDELAGWLATLDKFGREGDRQFFLECWNGDRPFTADRIIRGMIHVPAMCLSIVGCIQPGRLRQYLSDAVKDGPGNDGLFQRFQLLVWPDFPKTWTLVDRPLDRTAAERVVRVYERSAALPADDPIRFRFADDAQELFYTWWPEVQRKTRGGDLHPALAAHLAKYSSLMPSLALLFELSDTEDFSAPHEVSLPRAAQAAEWCDYLEAHARRFYGCIVSPALRAARVLAEKIAAKKLPADFTLRDVYRPQWSGLTTPEEGRAALRVLEDHAWVRPALCADEGPGRPSERWQTNPGILEARV